MRILGLGREGTKSVIHELVFFSLRMKRMSTSPYVLRLALRARWGLSRVTLVCLGVVRGFFDGDDEEREVALKEGERKAGYQELWVGI